MFAYMAGHGEVVAGEYYFIAHDTTAQGIAINGVPLKRLKAAFDSSPSQRAFLWLDFCHSGGIIPRDLGVDRTTERSSAGPWRWFRARAN